MNTYTNTHNTQIDSQIYTYTQKQVNTQINSQMQHTHHKDIRFCNFSGEWSTTRDDLPSLITSWVAHFPEGARDLSGRGRDQDAGGRERELGWTPYRSTGKSHAAVRIRNGAYCWSVYHYIQRHCIFPILSPITIIIARISLIAVISHALYVGKNAHR